MTDPERVSLDDSNLGALLDELDAPDLDRLHIGVVRMDRDGRVVAYNTEEAELSGLAPAEVIGQDFFIQVAPCTNNYLVAQRYADEEDLDESIDYVFTFRMLPTPVRLRMIKQPGSQYQYLIVRRA